MYTGGLQLFTGIALLFESVVGLMLTWLLIHPLLVYSAVEEERQMLEKYGQKYLDYGHTAFQARLRFWGLVDYWRERHWHERMDGRCETP